MYACRLTSLRLGAHYITIIYPTISKLQFVKNGLKLTERRPRMGADTKPTIFLIPGAFARPACYDVLRPILQDQGYETATCALPSSDPAQAEECSCAADAEYIRQAHLVPLVEQQGKDVVVFAHSYGAQCGGPAANGLIHSTRRAQGKPGGVLGLIYLAGTIVPKDASLTDVMGSSEWPPYFRIDHVSPPSQATFCVHALISRSLAKDAQSLSQSSTSCMETPM